MSGGSYDYAFRWVDDMAERLSRKDQTPLRRAFAAHLKLVAKAMHNIEWVDSGDYGEGEDLAAMQAAMGDSAQAELAVTVNDARDVLAQLQRALAKVEGGE